jgi:PilZ domain
MRDQDLDLGAPSGTNLPKAEAALVPNGDLGCNDAAVENKTSPLQRRWPRYAVNIPVRITTQGPTRVLASQGQGTDLSWRGLAVTADLDLAVGTQIAVEFTPPYSGQTITFRCFIRNRNANHYGVEFITENDDDYRKAGELQQGLAAMPPDISRR